MSTPSMQESLSPRMHHIEKMAEVRSFSSAELDRLKVLHPKTRRDKSIKAFRELRTQVFSHSQGKNFICMVTSMYPQGGATHVASNLAAAIALDSAKTSVLVDANFLNPRLDALLSADANLGLSDYLAVQDMGVEFILYASGIKRLRVIPAGKHTAEGGQLFSSAKVSRFFGELKARYTDRFVIVDSPSVSESANDVKAMAQLCDFVILVVPYGKASKSEVNSAIEIIGEQRIAGTVFNHL